MKKAFPPVFTKAALPCVTPYVHIDTEAIQLSCPATVYSISILIYLLVYFSFPYLLLTFFVFLFSLTFFFNPLFYNFCLGGSGDARPPACSTLWCLWTWLIFFFLLIFLNNLITGTWEHGCLYVSCLKWGFTVVSWNGGCALAAPQVVTLHCKVGCSLKGPLGFDFLVRCPSSSAFPQGTQHLFFDLPSFSSLWMCQFALFRRTLFFSGDEPLITSGEILVGILYWLNGLRFVWVFKYFQTFSSCYNFML